MKRPVNPCDRKCERRSPTCHAECTDYARYEMENALYRDERNAAKERFEVRPGVVRMIKTQFKKWRRNGK